MRRDMDLIRRIMLELEEQDNAPLRVAIAGYPEETVESHLEMLVDGGLIEGNVVRSGTSGSVLVVNVERVTWQGHEFIDSARSDTVWNQAKSIVAEKSGSVSLQVMKEVLVQVTKGLIGLS